MKCERKGIMKLKLIQYCKNTRHSHLCTSFYIFANVHVFDHHLYVNETNDTIQSPYPY